MHYHWDLSMVLADSSRWWSAAGVTLLYSIATVVGGIVIGVICGLGLLSRRRWLTLPLEGYVEVFRCTPLLVQIVWFYYALPILLNFSLPAWLAAGLGLTLYMGAFCTEIFRAGVMSIGRGQWQAGRAPPPRRVGENHRQVPVIVHRRLPSALPAGFCSELDVVRNIGGAGLLQVFPDAHVGVAEQLVPLRPVL